MFSKLRKMHLQFLAMLFAVVVACSPTLAQQTLGGISGTVTDTTGSTIAGTSVTAIQDSTQLTRTATTSDNGSYSFVNLPIGSYTVTFTRDGFDAQKSPGINVQADRTLTLNVSLKVGSVNTSVEVDATPLMNATDTTNGYVLDKTQIESIPLATGSFTGLAILSPGVNAELSGGTGSNTGLGNAPIWANGQRDTSNSFLLNGVDSSNLFNGKSTSQVASARIVNSTGNGTPHAGGVIQSSSSIYLSIGNAIPSPAPETLSEVRVNASMYDAQQGSSSGAHIDMSTASGSNQYHGTAYVHRGTGWINAAPFFFNQDPNIPENMKVPQLHRYIAGGTFGGPIIKNKLFGFVGYQHLHTSDQEIGSSFFSVPVGLGDDRSAGGLATVANNGWGGNYSQPLTAANINPTAVYLMNLPALPGQPGKWLFPNDDGTSLTVQHYDNAFVPGTAYFIADQAVADLDWNATQKDSVDLKYYYQHDPTIAPYAYSSVPGFAQHLDTGSQVGSITNTLILKTNLSTTQTFGFIREKIYSTNEQAITAQDANINEFGSSYFPGIAIVDPLGSNKPTGAQNPITSIGLDPNAQASLTGAFQNRWMPSGNAIWLLGKHTVNFGGSYEYTQLNARDRRPGTGTIATSDFSQFVQGLVTTNDDFRVTTYLQGDANRYYRANQTGFYLQDKYLIKPTLTLTGGIRYDWNGGLTEKYGRVFNFDPTLYNYSSTSDTIINNGFIIAGNNAQGTKGVSNTTLTGRQWGIAPRLGFAWTPRQNNGTIVFRGGAGMYYDRGELYTYFSPGYAIGAVTGGPFGVSQSPPFVNAQTCASPTTSYYLGYIPTCDPAVGNLNNPWGAELGPAPTGKASDVTNYLPNAAGILNGEAPFSIGVYDRKNKLPYSINYTFDMQWQPRNDLAIDIGYVGTLSRHQVIPVPMNQPNIASPTTGVNCPGPACQHYTYGYTLKDSNFNSQPLPDGTTYLSNYEGGNVDLRVPYIGYAAESIDYKAAGVASYNAMQVHVEKRMSHGLQVGFSYTYSHATDEQSAMGLFYNGNNPLNLRSGYGSSDFDRTHVVNFSYVYQLPDFFSKSSREGKAANGWAFEGITVIQSGQPFSVIDYTGSVGSIYYSVYDGITNPIVPLGNGCSARSATTGASGAFTAGSGQPFLKSNCFTVPLLAPGSFAGGIPDGSNNSVADTYETNFTTGQRNIFRQAYQRRADISLVKMTALTERFTLKYTFDVFNLTNTTSFDVTGDNVSQNQYYDQYPVAGTTPLPTGCDINGNQTNSSFYNCPTGLGITTHAISSPRQIQMSLRLIF